MNDIFEKLFGSRSASTSGPVEYVVAALGNPGKKYESTRHNAGFMTADYMADKKNFDIKRVRFNGLTGDTTIAGKRVLIIKPTTYMNLSGQPVQEALDYYKLGPDKLIVISDDVALDVGKMRIRRAGSDGGQKGLRDIITCLGTQDFARIRIGVGGKPHPSMDMADWVLSRFTPEDLKLLLPVFDDAMQAVELMVQGNISDAMSKYN